MDESASPDDERVTEEMARALREAAGESLANLDASSTLSMLASLAQVAQGAEARMREERYVAPAGPAMLSLSSPALAEGATITARHTEDGANESPELHIEGIATGAVSMMLTLVDSDAGLLQPSTCWMLWNIPPRTRIPAAVEKGWRVPALGMPARQGRSWRGEYYAVPQRTGREGHRLVFTLRVLDTWLDLRAATRRKAVEQAAEGHVLQEARLTVRIRE